MAEKKWTIEEDLFVTDKYKEGYSMEDISLGLDRTIKAVKYRVKILGLIEPREKNSLWRCAKCKEYKNIESFKINSKNGTPRSYCIECNKINAREYYIRKKLGNELSQRPIEKSKEEVHGSSDKKCTMCGEVKNVNEFPWNRKYKSLIARCSKCHARKTKEYETKRFREKGY